MNILTKKQCQYIAGGTVAIDYSNTNPNVVTITITDRDDVLHINSYTFTRDFCYYNNIPINAAEFNILMTKHDRSFWLWGGHSYTTIQYVQTGKYI